MKTKNIVYILVAAISLSFMSCENEIDFKGEILDPLLVVNSFISPDSVIKVHVSKSKFFLKDNSSFDLINNATVNLWVNNVKKEQLTSIGDGLYVATYKPVIGDIIKITAQNNQFSEVNGNAEIPKPSEIASVDTSYTTLESTPLTQNTYKGNGIYNIDTIGYSKNRQFDFTLNFKDPAGIENFYRLNITQRNHYPDGAIREIPFYYSTEDLVFGNNSDLSIFGSNNYSYYHEFSDDLFDGKNYGLKFYTTTSSFVYNIGYDPKTGEVSVYTPIKCELIIDLQSISKSYYLYIKTRMASSGDSGTDFFTEPVQIFSNVNGGIGVIGSYSHSYFTKEIPVSTNQGYYFKAKD